MTISITSYPDDYTSIINESLSELTDFFQFSLETKPCLVIVDSHKHFEEIYGYKAPMWLTGLSLGNVIFILDPLKWSTESNKEFLPEKLKQQIKHELAHQYYRYLAHKNNPKWLSEGMSLFLADQLKYHPKNSDFDNFLKFTDKTEMDGLSVYQESGSVVKKIVEKYGKEKLLELIRSCRGISSDDDFQNSFKSIFGSKISYDLVNSL